MKIAQLSRAVILLLLIFQAGRALAQTASPQKNPPKPFVPPPYHSFAATKPAATSLEAEIATIQEQIHEAELENAQYTGGLVKTLVVARIAILRQTGAMLQQKSKASALGISLQYIIDGTPFVPPASSSDVMRSLELELTANQAKIASQEIEVARYSGGLIQAVSLSTLATMRQTQAMLDQKRLALKYGLPQFVGFGKPTGDAAQPLAPKTNAGSLSIEKDWRIVSIDSKVTESNTVWSRYSWKLTIQNQSNAPQVFRGTIEFQDSDGFIVDTDATNNLVVPSNSEEVFTGSKLVNAQVAGKVTRTVAKIGKGR